MEINPILKEYTRELQKMKYSLEQRKDIISNNTKSNLEKILAKNYFKKGVKFLIFTGALGLLGFCDSLSKYEGFGGEINTYTHEQK